MKVVEKILLLELIGLIIDCACGESIRLKYVFCNHQQKYFTGERLVRIKHNNNNKTRDRGKMRERGGSLI